MIDEKFRIIFTLNIKLSGFFLDWHPLPEYDYRICTLDDYSTTQKQTEFPN